jgi:hypothetical protein
VRAVLGLGIGLAALGAGVLLFGVEDRPVPELRGVGVVSWARNAKGAFRQVHPEPGQGLALSAAVRIRSCGKPLRVSVIASGTAEYWADHAARLRRGGKIEIAVPDLDLRNVDVRLGTDGKTAPVAPLAEEPDATAIKIEPLEVRRLTSVTVVGAEIPKWGEHLRPVIVSFDADWTEGRSYLGSCYLRLPALAGFPTVLSAREILGDAVKDVTTLPGSKSALVVSSKETKLEAYYRAEYETTRGVTSIELGSSALRTDLSQPAPDTNVRGAPSWTCSSTPPRSLATLDTIDADDPPEILQGEESGALSTSRLGAAIKQKTCASYTVVEQSGAAVSRDITGLLIGALFSFGVGLFLEGTRRSRRATE